MSILKHNNILIIILLVCSSAIAEVNLPDFTFKSNILDKQEKIKVKQSLYESGLLNNDIEYTVYLNKLGNKLVKYSDWSNEEFDFYLFNIDEINAFAASGAQIGVYTGLVAKSNSESELASVIAHEIAHIIQQHIKRYQQGTSKSSYLLAAGVLAGIVLGGNVGSGILSSTAAGLLQQSINFTREHEWEADRVGMNILVKAGFDAQGMPDFFRKLMEVDRQNSLEFLRTHPLSINRVADAQQRANKFKKKNIKSSLDYEFIRARIIYKNNKKKLFKKQLIAQYIKTLNLFKQEKYKTALIEIKKLLLKNQSNSIKFLAAKIYFKNQQPQQVIEMMNNILRMDNDNEVATYYLAKAYQKNQQIFKAIKLLRVFIRSHKTTVLSDELLASLYLSSKNIVRYHMQMSEVFVKKGIFITAIQQLEQAKKHTYDQILLSRIKAKISKISKWIKEYQF
ncbi:Exported zinc metalloprotease YfgC precursor [hydrothermal vent metagenome]|uniref:Exported zinc metalloprotease YfgC n=1 Tax=hydrothermal vent metagenome TaxID=652676 RepID=A0A1W1BGT3_9ZZZZ